MSVAPVAELGELPTMRILADDNVVGTDPARRDDWRGAYDVSSAFHRFLAGS
jgi:hypothetical protein